MFVSTCKKTINEESIEKKDDTYKKDKQWKTQIIKNDILWKI